MRVFLSTEECLSQAWISPPILIVSLALIKIQFFTSSLLGTLSSLQNSANTSCLESNNFFNESLSFVELLQTAVEAVVKDWMVYTLRLVKLLVSISIAIAASLISFALEIYLGTITCLSFALVQGTIEFAAQLLRLVSSALEEAVNAVLADFNKAMGVISTAINAVVLGVDALNSIFGSKNLPDTGTFLKTVLKVNLTISSLKNVAIPTLYIDKIGNFSEEIPNFDIVLSNVSSLLTRPLHRLAINVEQLPVPTWNEASSKKNILVSSRDTLLPLCTKLEDVFTKARALAVSGSRIASILLAVALLILTAATFFIVYYKCKKKTNFYRCLAAEDDPCHVGNKIMQFESGLMRIFALKLSKNIQWWLNYSLSDNMLNCLVIAVMGYISVGFQWSVLRAVSREVSRGRGLLNSPEMQEIMQGQFSTFLDVLQTSVNGLVLSLNSALFASCKNTSSELLLNMQTFQETTNSTLSSVFNNTPFAAPIRTIVYCTVGRKIEAVEDGLTWVTQNLNIPSPQILLGLKSILGSSNSSKWAGNPSLMALNMIANIGESYDKAEKQIRSGIRAELIICSIFMGIWILFAAIGGCIVYFRQRGKKVVVEKEISWPKRHDFSGPRDFLSLDRLPRTASSSYSEAI